MDHVDAIKTALRVLSALTARNHPEPSDVTALRCYAPDMPDATLFELCSESVTRATRANCAAYRAGVFEA